VDGENSGVDVEGPPALEHCLTSGESTPYGPITPIALCLNDAGLVITSDCGSYFGATGSGFKSYEPKKPSPFSSLLYVGRPTTPFEPPSVSVFDPFGLDDDTLPPCHFGSVHVGVDIMKELLADEEEVPEAGHVISPFDQLKHDILCDTPTTMEQGILATEAFTIDHTASPDFADSISSKILSSIDMLALSKRVASWIDRTLDTADDRDDEILDHVFTSCDAARDEAVYNAECYADDSDSDLDDEDEDFPPIVLEHRGVKYTILGELGQGTYGQVVLARTSLGAEVAIKICGKSRDGMTAGQLRKVVLNERNVLVRISAEDEPFLTQPLACFQDETNVYFVLVSSVIFSRWWRSRLITSYSVCTQRTWLKFYKSLIVCYPWRKSSYGPRNWYLLCSRHSLLVANAFVLQLLGIQSLHSLRVVHRDLKPDNVLISPNGHLAIADFGFAKSFSKRSWANARMTEPLGTAGYLAPEILDHHLPTVGYSSAVDVWGFGMILLEMLLGKVGCFCVCLQTLY
jgi:Protein kinase domain